MRCSTFENCVGGNGEAMVGMVRRKWRGGGLVKAVRH